MTRNLLIPVERLLNRYVHESSVAEDALLGLQGQSLRIVVDGLGLVITMAAVDGEIALQSVSEGQAATATVRGAPVSLLRLLRRDAPQALANAGVVLEGDAEVASAFWKALRGARPDLEEELSRLVGDVLAHGIGTAARDLDAWGRRALAALGSDTSEFLQEEARQLPSRPETQAFLRNVESLRDDVERTEYRLDRLERELEQCRESD